MIGNYINPPVHTLSGGVGQGYSLIWPIRGCAAGQGIVFDLSVLDRVVNVVCVCQQGIACTVDLICKINFVFTLSTQKGFA